MSVRALSSSIPTHNTSNRPCLSSAIDASSSPTPPINSRGLDNLSEATETDQPRNGSYRKPVGAETRGDKASYYEQSRSAGRMPSPEPSQTSANGRRRRSKRPRSGRTRYFVNHADAPRYEYLVQLAREYHWQKGTKSDFCKWAVAQETKLDRPPGQHFTKGIDEFIRIHLPMFEAAVPGLAARSRPRTCSHRRSEEQPPDKQDPVEAECHDPKATHPESDCTNTDVNDWVPPSQPNLDRSSRGPNSLPRSQPRQRTSLKQHQDVNLETTIDDTPLEVHTSSPIVGHDVAVPSAVDSTDVHVYNHQADMDPSNDIGFAQVGNPSTSYSVLDPLSLHHDLVKLLSFAPSEDFVSAVPGCLLKRFPDLVDLYETDAVTVVLALAGSKVSMAKVKYIVTCTPCVFGYIGLIADSSSGDILVFGLATEPFPDATDDITAKEVCLPVLVSERWDPTVSIRRSPSATGLHAGLSSGPNGPSVRKSIDAIAFKLVQFFLSQWAVATSQMAPKKQASKRSGQVHNLGCISKPLPPNSCELVAYACLAQAITGAVRDSEPNAIIRAIHATLDSDLTHLAYTTAARLGLSDEGGL
ncbi:hypothetical protein IAU59_007631 [Kwoniella sp. CBS 9459]